MNFFLQSLRDIQVLTENVIYLINIHKYIVFIYKYYIFKKTFLFLYFYILFDI